MSDEFLPHNDLISDRPHPAIRRTIIALAVWLLLWVWAFYGGRAGTGLVLAVVSFFLLVVLTLGAVLHRIWLRGERIKAPQNTGGSNSTLPEWLAGIFRSAHGEMSAKDAAIEILLPIAAVTLGMSMFAIVADLVI